jgi:hypothetical protein
MFLRLAPSSDCIIHHPKKLFNEAITSAKYQTQLWKNKFSAMISQSIVHPATESGFSAQGILSLRRPS